jgi:hypothetical protein
MLKVLFKILKAISNMPLSENILFSHYNTRENYTLCL